MADPKRIQDVVRKMMDEGKDLDKLSTVWVCANLLDIMLLSHDLENKIKKQREALAFAKSTILSGEVWSKTCEEIIQGALDDDK